MTLLTRRAGASLHHQLYSILLSSISSGKYAKGSLLPSEDALADTYQVSRATVRRSMQTLEEKGIVRRRHGVGAQVIASLDADARADYPVMNLVGSFTEASELEILGFGFVPASSQLAAKLDLNVGDTILHVTRLRRIDGIPFRLTHHYLPEALGRRLTAEMLEQRPLISILIDIGCTPQRADNIISATLADVAEADPLQVDIGAPMLELSRVVRDPDRRPILVQQAFSPASRERLFIETDVTAKPAGK